MNVIISLAGVIILFAAGMFGAGSYPFAFSVVAAYLALAVFLVGIVYRVWTWAKVPVPFRIPTTCGQQKSLSWIKQDKLENPHTTFGVIIRMTLEVLCFRSLFRNTKTELAGDHLVHTPNLWLWLASMGFHWSMLVILVRHLRFFTEPIPGFVTYLQQAEGLLHIGVPAFYATSVIFLGALGFLLVRRLAEPQIRYISLASDYFPLFLLLGIGISGFWIRHVAKTDIVGVKELVMGLVGFKPVVLETVAPLFYGHFFLVCVLLAYLPFSKLTHMAGVFFSPTRNLANNNRMVRHVNPWDYPVKVHSYEDYEDELRDKMKGAGVPVDKE